MHFDAAQVPAAPPDTDPWGDSVTRRSPGSVQVIDYGTGYIGVQTAAGYFSVDTAGQSGLEYVLDDGSTLTRSVTEPDLASYTLASPDGSTRSFLARPSDQGKDVVMTPLLSSVTDPDGRTTSYARDTAGALLSVTLPNQDVWTYQHELGDRRITKATAPDNTTTKYEYDQATGRVSRIAIYPTDSCGAGTELSNMQIVYTDAAGNIDYQARPLSASKGNHEVTYQYASNSITVTERDKNQPWQEFSKTIYAYDTAGGTTTVTRKHPSNSAYDQETRYEYYTKEGYKTWLFTVTDAENKTTRYSRYVSLATDTADKIEDVDFKRTTNKLLYGKVFKVTDALGRETDYDYNPNGSLASVTYPVDSASEEYYYTDSAGNDPQLKKVKNVRGNYTYYVRDPNALHRVLKIKVDSQDHSDAEWAQDGYGTLVRQFAYYTSGSQVGLVQTETIPEIDGNEPCVKTYVYTQSGNVQPGPTQSYYRYWNGSAYVDAMSTTEYDASGRVSKTTDANGRHIWYTYDALGRSLQTIYMKDGETATRFTENVYDCCNLKQSIDENGHSTRYKYDAAGRVLKVWTDIQSQAEDTNTPLVEYEYDGFGNVSYVRTRSDENTYRTTGYVYDDNNRVVEIRHPGYPSSPLGTEYFQYDDVGNLVGKKDGNAVITAYEYDDLNRLTKVDYEHGYWPVQAIVTADVTYTYYPGTRLRHEMADSTGMSHYDYDIQDRLAHYTPPNHGVIDYAYNNLGQKTSVTNGSQTVGYQYFANGWLKAVTDGTNAYAVYSYDTAGNRIGVTLGNGATTAYAYDSDPRYRVESITHTPTVGNPVTISYPSRDSSGNPLSMQDWNGTTTYDYDANSRLVSSGQFAYDWVGNRTSPGSMAYDDADRLTRWPGQHQYEYDSAGNLQYEYDDANPRNLQKTYAYTPAGLLSSVTHAGVSNQSLMTWDGAGRRVTFTSSTEPGNPYTFVYDATASIPAVVEETCGGSPTYYVREPSGALIVRISGSGEAQTVRYYHFDELGSTRLLTDATGAVTDIYTYDAWGNLLSHTGSTEQPYQYVGEFGYYSHYQDENLPLLQLSVRCYAPQIGRFVARDFVQDGITLYAYVFNDPTTAIDPLGLFCIPVGYRTDWLGRKYLGHSAPQLKIDVYIVDVPGGIGQQVHCVYIAKVTLYYKDQYRRTTTWKCYEKCRGWYSKQTVHDWEKERHEAKEKRGYYWGGLRLGWEEGIPEVVCKAHIPPDIVDFMRGYAQ